LKFLKNLCQYGLGR